VRVVLFGATGMVGQGVLRECLLDPDVESVVTVGRRANGQIHPKLRELVHKDLLDLAPLESELTGLDAAFFCLGVTSAGMTEADYTRVTYDITMAAAASLVRLSPSLTFVFVSGSGADSTEQGRTMWARVKGKTENALLRLPFRAIYVLRPAVIQPLHGITSRTGSYRVFYAIAKPLFPLVKRVFPKYVTTTEQIGLAMLKVAKRGASKKILETPEINGM
jgi:uncharacterized protein YbjT (DUF2867 family)